MCGCRLLQHKWSMLHEATHAARCHSFCHTDMPHSYKSFSHTTKLPTCERQCGAVHSHRSITSLTHITAIVWPLKVVNNKWWGGRHSTAGVPDANVGRVVDKSYSILCPGDGQKDCCRTDSCAVQLDHRSLHNVVHSAIVFEENIWEGIHYQPSAHNCMKKKIYSWIFSKLIFIHWSCKKHAACVVQIPAANVYIVNVPGMKRACARRPKISILDKLRGFEYSAHHHMRTLATCIAYAVVWLWWGTRVHI